MKTINAMNLDHKQIGQLLWSEQGEVTLENCRGQRFIAAGTKNLSLNIHGVPGNALGAYLSGSRIDVHGNAQDAVGDTMDDGEIVIRGNAGDALGYAMRGGAIYVQGSTGYRSGIHMKAYREKLPVMVIGGSCASFLGEYQAGGLIVVLALGGGAPAGDFCGTGMHGGRIYLRGDISGMVFPPQVILKEAKEEDMEQIRGYISRFCKLFGTPEERIYQEAFHVLVRNSKNPYHQLYVTN